MVSQKLNLSAASRGCKDREHGLRFISAASLRGLLFFLMVFYAPFVSAAAEEEVVYAPDKAILQGLQAVQKNQWDTGRNLIAGAHDKLASKLYYWFYFQKGKGDDANYPALVQFVRTNPDWPGISKLRLMAEDKMPENLGTAEILAWFKDYPPLTARGLQIYLDALILSGDEENVRQLLFDWWTRKSLSRKYQKEIYTKYKKYISAEAHKKRFNMLLFEGHYTSARAIAKLLDAGYPALAEARIAVAEKKSDANALIAKVPRSLSKDPGLLYERLKYRREKNLDEDAVQILRNEPDLRLVSNPGDWWRERHILARRFMEERHFRQAYELVAAHKQEEGLPFAQAEWLAGWLALRFLNDPLIAYKHFEKLYRGVSTPISQSRAAYWAGRAATALNQQEPAMQWYRLAARYQTTFYGQTAGAELGMAQALDFAAPPRLTLFERQEFERDELIRAVHLLSRSGLRSEASQFLHAFADSKPTAKRSMFAVELAAEIKNYGDVVKIAKEATKDGLFLTAQSFPTISDQLSRVSIDWALVHSIIRQESQFDQYAQSPAGALGLMQLMPGTATETARKIGVSHSTVMLTSNPAHNIMLGSEYLRQMLVRFGGSYPLAIAAYNAGPRRVDEWLTTFGDPRVGQVDMIDWIEMIPIYETRNYVQRVLENVFVYNLRLRDVGKNMQEPIHVVRVYSR